MEWDQSKHKLWLGDSAPQILRGGDQNGVIFKQRGKGSTTAETSKSAKENEADSQKEEGQKGSYES